MRKGIRYAGAFVAVLLIWQISSVALNKNFFPRPLETCRALFELFKSGIVWKHIWASAYRIITGTLIALIIAFPIGLLLGCSKNADIYIGNIFNILYPIPKVVFLPIIVVCLGIGDEPKIFLIALVIGFQLVLTIRDAVHHIPEELIRAMHLLHPSKIQYMRHLVIPACLPEVFSALRSTLGISTALLFITENFAAVTGLGYFITKSMDSRNFGDMYSGILMLALLGVLLYLIFVIAESYVCKWKYIKSSSEN